MAQQQYYQNCGYGPSTCNSSYAPAVVEERGAYHFQPQSSGGYGTLNAGVQPKAFQQPQCNYQQPPYNYQQSQQCPPQQGQSFAQPRPFPIPYNSAPPFPVNWGVNSQPFLQGASQGRGTQERYWNAYDGEAGQGGGEEGGKNFNPRAIYESMIDLPINIATAIRQRKIDMYHWAISDIFAAFDYIRERQEMMLEGIKGIFLGPLIEDDDGTKGKTFSDPVKGVNPLWAFPPNGAATAPLNFIPAPTFRYPTFTNGACAAPSAPCNPVPQQHATTADVPCRQRRESSVSAHTPNLNGARRDSSCGPATSAVTITTEDGDDDDCACN